MLAQSSDSFARWMETIPQGVSPHGNAVVVKVVAPGTAGRAPEDRKSYWVGNVAVNDHLFTIGEGGLVIINAVDGRYVFYCPKLRSNPMGKRPYPKFNPSLKLISGGSYASGTGFIWEKDLEDGLTTWHLRPFRIRKSQGVDPPYVLVEGRDEDLEVIGHYYDLSDAMRVAERLLDRMYQENPDKMRPNPVDEGSIVARINDIIRGQTSYGYREWPIEKKTSCILAWSNAQAGWYAFPLSRWLDRTRAPGTLEEMAGRKRTIKLDANYILVPYATKAVQPLLSRLAPLPLYAQSFEAGMKKNARRNPVVTPDSPLTPEVEAFLVAGGVPMGWESKPGNFYNQVDAPSWCQPIIAMGIKQALAAASSGKTTKEISPEAYIFEMEPKFQLSRDLQAAGWKQWHTTVAVEPPPGVAVKKTRYPVHIWLSPVGMPALVKIKLEGKYIPAANNPRATQESDPWSRGPSWYRVTYSPIKGRKGEIVVRAIQGKKAAEEVVKVLREKRPGHYSIVEIW